MVTSGMASPNSSSTRSATKSRSLAEQLDLAALEVDHAEPGLEDQVGEGQGDHPAEQLGDLLQLDRAVGADDLLEEDLRIGDLHHAEAVGPHLDHPEVGVAHGDGLGRPPAQVGDRPGVDEVDLAAERALEAVLPPLEGGEQGQVLGGQLEVAGPEAVGQLAPVDEHRLLALADDQLGPVLDLVLVAGEPPGEGRAGVVHPLDDVDQLALDLVHQAHDRSLVDVARGVPRQYPPTPHRAEVGPAPVRGLRPVSPRAQG